MRRMLMRGENRALRIEFMDAPREPLDKVHMRMADFREVRLGIAVLKEAPYFIPERPCDHC